MPKDVEKKKAITRKALSNHVGALLGLPRAGWQGEAYQIVQTVLQVIVETLAKGQTIKIDGFGIFRPYERPATRSPIYHFYGKAKDRPWEVISLPPKKRIVFQPSKALIRFINS